MNKFPLNSITKCFQVFKAPGTNQKLFTLFGAGDFPTILQQSKDGNEGLSTRKQTRIIMQPKSRIPTRGMIDETTDYA